MWTSVRPFLQFHHFPLRSSTLDQQSLILGLHLDAASEVAFEINFRTNSLYLSF